MRSFTLAQAPAVLERLQQAIRRFAGVPQRTAVLAAPEVAKLPRTEFEQGADPYGNPWEPLKPSSLYGKRGSEILVNTGKMRDGTVAEVVPGGIRVRSGAQYSKFAQGGFTRGKTHVQPRKIFPSQGIPHSWSLVLKKAAHDACVQAGRV
jgi:hypothetical protein